MKSLRGFKMSEYTTRQINRLEALNHLQPDPVFVHSLGLLRQIEILEAKASREPRRELYQAILKLDSEQIRELSKIDRVIKSSPMLAKTAKNFDASQIALFPGADWRQPTKLTEKIERLWLERLLTPAEQMRLNHAQKCEFARYENALFQARLESKTSVEYRPHADADLMPVELHESSLPETPAETRLALICEGWVEIVEQAESIALEVHGKAKLQLIAAGEVAAECVFPIHFGSVQMEISQEQLFSPSLVQSWLTEHGHSQGARIGNALLQEAGLDAQGLIGQMKENLSAQTSAEIERFLEQRSLAIQCGGGGFSLIDKAEAEEAAVEMNDFIDYALRQGQSIAIEAIPQEQRI